MDKRSTESPMDFEWQTRAPGDVTSPFYQLSIQHENQKKRGLKLPLLFYRADIQSQALMGCLTLPPGKLCHPYENQTPNPFSSPRRHQPQRPPHLPLQVESLAKHPLPHLARLTLTSHPGRRIFHLQRMQTMMRHPTSLPKKRSETRSSVCTVVLRQVLDGVRSHDSTITRMRWYAEYRRNVAETET